MWLLDEDDEGSGFCACGLTIPYGQDECELCDGAPHHRECPCDECCAYWAVIALQTRMVMEPAYVAIVVDDATGKVVGFRVGDSATPRAANSQASPGD